MIDLDLTWLVPLRWPLVVVLVALAIFAWRRRPERPEPWAPPASRTDEGAPVDERESGAES